MNKRRIVACVICQLLYNIFNVFFTWVIMQITDSLVYGDSSVFVNYLGIAGIGVGCQILFNFLSFRLQNKIINSSMTTIRTKSLYGVNEMNSVKEIKDKVSTLCDKADEHESEMVYSSNGGVKDVYNRR